MLINNKYWENEEGKIYAYKKISMLKDVLHESMIKVMQDKKINELTHEIEASYNKILFMIEELETLIRTGNYKKALEMIEIIKHYSNDSLSFHPSCISSINALLSNLSAIKVRKS